MYREVGSKCLKQCKLSLEVIERLTNLNDTLCTKDKRLNSVLTPLRIVKF